METLKDPTKRRFFQGKVRQPQVIRLPWIISESVFTQNCTQCQDCINACDTKIIIQDQQGFPKIDFSQGECSFCQKVRFDLHTVGRSFRAFSAPPFIQRNC